MSIAASRGLYRVSGRRLLPASLTLTVGNLKAIIFFLGAGRLRRA